MPREPELRGEGRKKQNGQSDVGGALDRRGRVGGSNRVAGYALRSRNESTFAKRPARASASLRADWTVPSSPVIR